MEEFLVFKKGGIVIESEILEKINASYIDFDIKEENKMKEIYPLIEEWKT